MPGFELESLSNREYDDYFRRHMDRVMHQAESVRSLLATNVPVACDDPRCEYYHVHSAPPARSQAYRARRRSIGHAPSRQQQQQWRTVARPHDQRTDINDIDTSAYAAPYYGSYDTGRLERYDDGIRLSKNQRRRPRTRSATSPRRYHDQTSFYYSDIYGSDDPDYGSNERRSKSTYAYRDDNTDDDDSSMVEREILAAQNAQRNAARSAYTFEDESSNAQPEQTSTPPVEQPEQQSDETEPIQSEAGTNISPPSEQSPQNPQVPLITTPPSMSTTTAATTNISPGKRRGWFLSRIFGKRRPSSHPSMTPSPSQSSTMSTNSSSLGSNTGRGAIRSVKTDGPLGDVLDPQQQSEIVRQLSNSPGQQQGVTNDMLFVAKLDYIWVFRASEDVAGRDQVNLWIGFDYKNQQRLTAYMQYLHRMAYTLDQGIELFDSHICRGEYPVLVLPSRRLGYYPTDSTGDHIATLQVACFPNTPDLQFVYRHSS